MISTRTHSISLRDAASIEKNPITFNGFIDPLNLLNPFAVLTLRATTPSAWPSAVGWFGRETTRDATVHHGPIRGQ